MKNTLDTELATYETNKDKLVAEAEGKFIVIKGEKILQSFDTEQDAIKAGYQEFGVTAPFLIKKVQRVEGVYFFSPSPVHNAMFEKCHV